MSTRCRNVCSFRHRFFILLHDILFRERRKKTKRHSLTSGETYSTVALQSTGWVVTYAIGALSQRWGLVTKHDGENTSRLLKYMFAHRDVYKYFREVRSLCSALPHLHPQTSFLSLQCCQPYGNVPKRKETESKPSVIRLRLICI
jgi:hypothetical protein